MSTFNSAQRKYDNEIPLDDRNDDQIEQDVADRLRAEQEAAMIEGYVYSPEVWAKVTAARMGQELKNIGSLQGSDKERPAYPRCAGNTEQLINAVRRVLADPNTKMLGGYRTALEQLTQ